MSLLPFYHHSSRGRRQLYIPPLLVYHRTGESRLLTVGPGYTYRNPDTIGLGIAPLLFVGWSEQRSHHVLFPLLWHLRSPDRRTVVIGSAYYHRRGSRLGVGLAPLVFYRRTPSSRSLNLLPLFSYGSYRDGRQRHLATPLFFVEGNTSHQRSQWGLMVPPFYRLRTPRLEVDLQVPLFLRWHDVARPSTTWILGGALWWHRSPSVRSHGLFPLYWHVRGPDRSFTLAGPYAHHSRPGHVGHSLWPLLHYHRTATPDGSRTTVAVLPAVFYRSGPSGSSLLSVLFGYHHGDGFQTWYAGPYVNHRRGQRRTDVLFPLLWSHRRPERSTVVVFPLLWHDRQRHRTCTVLFPLLWHFRRPTHRATVLFPVYWDFARGDRRTTVALNTLFIREKSKRTYDFHFLPLVRVQRKRPTDIKLSLLAGLFGYERIGRNRYLKLLLIPIELDRE